MAVVRLIETDTLSNQNIATALEIGSYTADAARKLFVQVMVDQVAGNDDYVVYLTRQLAGAGSAYKSPVTTESVASGVTSILFPSIPITVSNTDVVKVHLTGASGDTTTPDTRVEWWEECTLAPTTAGRTLDVAATGEAGLDFDNIKAATGATTLTNITVPAVTATTSVTNGVSLANDAITSAKFDESTAFPVKSEDAGATKIARTGADSDTLETLSDEIATVDSNVDAILVDTGTDGVVLAANAITSAKIATDAITSDELAASAIAEIVAGVLTTAMTEAYAADGATVTVAQALYEIMQWHNERTVGATTITVNKRDGITPAFTLTYDSDSITRAT